MLNLSNNNLFEVCYKFNDIINIIKIPNKKIWKYGQNLTRIIISMRSHPSELLALLDNIPQISITKHTGINSEQLVIRMNRRQIQAHSISKNDIYHSRFYVDATVERVDQSICTSGRNHSNRKSWFRQLHIWIVEINLLLSSGSGY